MRTATKADGIVTKELASPFVAHVDLGHQPPSARTARPAAAAVERPKDLGELGLRTPMLRRGHRILDDLAVDQLDGAALVAEPHVVLVRCGAVALGRGGHR